MGIEALPDGQSGRTLVAVTGGPFFGASEAFDVGILHILDKHVPIEKQGTKALFGVADVGGKLRKAVDLDDLREPADVIPEGFRGESGITVSAGGACRVGLGEDGIERIEDLGLHDQQGRAGGEGLDTQFVEVVPGIAEIGGHSLKSLGDVQRGGGIGDGCERTSLHFSDDKAGIID